jgi:hypothetical protein
VGFLGVLAVSGEAGFGEGGCCFGHDGLLFLM